MKLLLAVGVEEVWEEERIEKAGESSVSGHLGKGLVELVGDGLKLLLLMDQFI